MIINHPNHDNSDNNYNNSIFNNNTNNNNNTLRNLVWHATSLDVPLGGGDPQVPHDARVVERLQIRDLALEGLDGLGGVAAPVHLLDGDEPPVRHVHPQEHVPVPPAPDQLPLAEPQLFAGPRPAAPPRGRAGLPRGRARPPRREVAAVGRQRHGPSLGRRGRQELGLRVEDLREAAEGPAAGPGAAGGTRTGGSAAALLAASEAAPEAVRQAVGGGCQSG